MKKLTSWGIIIAGVIMLGVIYFFIDPSKYHMPRCPFNALTGLLCHTGHSFQLEQIHLRNADNSFCASPSTPGRNYAQKQNSDFHLRKLRRK